MYGCTGGTAQPNKKKTKRSGQKEVYKKKWTKNKMQIIKTFVKDTYSLDVYGTFENPLFLASCIFFKLSLLNILSIWRLSPASSPCLFFSTFQRQSSFR